MTPLASNTYTVGQLCTFHWVEIGPLVPLFQNDRQVMFSSFIRCLMCSRSVSLLTPTRTKGLPSRRFTSDRSCGYMARQGPHQSPQKSSVTTFPRRSLSFIG